MHHLRFEPLSLKNWNDLETLFGPRGACAGCWCMWWRLTRSQWQKGQGNGNKRRLKNLARSQSPGILAYSGSEPLGWCAIAPRAEYRTLARSRVLSPVDDQPVWSVTCFYVARKFRRTGVTAALLRAAVAFARKRGAKIVEGYPIEPGKATVAEVFAYTGFSSTFHKAGFGEVARRSPTRPIMRRKV